MELVFRIREDRLDKHGRAAVWADIHWPQHRIQPGVGVKVEPANWQPGKEKRIKSRETDSNAKNLRLTKVATAVGKVFTSAEGAGRMPADISADEVHAAVLEALAPEAQLLRQRRQAAVAPAPKGLTTQSTWEEFEAQWIQENQHHFAVGTLRLYHQVVNHINEFDPALRLANLTKARLAEYVNELRQRELKDSTVQRHYKFFRDCYRIAELAVPDWLEFPSARYGRALVLKREEVWAWQAVELPAGKLTRERDVFLFQMLLLLRDSDLRGLKRHHVREMELPRYGNVLCAELYQEKTIEPVLLPLPPQAAAIWQAYEGRLPVVDISDRNQHLKEIAHLAGLEREFVQMSFSGKQRFERVGPVAQFISTHTARHTGAGLITWGSGGDQNLKEVALGHVGKGASVYGYDTLDRYGPALLDAWQTSLQAQKPLAETIPANGLSVIPRRFSFRK